MAGRSASFVWRHFSKDNSDDGMFAICNHCSSRLSRSGGSTSTLRKHLEKMHREVYQDELAEQQETEAASSAESAQKPAESAKETAKVQVKLSQLTKKKLDDTDPKSITIDTTIAEMIALDDLPFSHVEDLGFMRLMQKTMPLYRLKTRKFYTNKVQDLCVRLRGNIESLLNENLDMKLSFTTDIWSNEYESLCSLTMHGITGEFKRIHYVLHARPLSNERHTGEHLRDVLMGMIDEWEIDKERVHIVVRDSGTNIIKALTLAGIPSASCAAHTLNLIVKEGLDFQAAVKNMGSTCRKIAGRFNRSDVARKQLDDIQRRVDSEKTPLRVIQESPTRWNSTYEMLSRMLELKDSLALFATANNITDWGLQWNILEKTCKGLKPFLDATQRVSGANSTIGDVIPVINWLKQTFSRTENTSAEVGIGSMMTAIREALKKRFADLECLSAYYLATYLDPRYKNKIFTRSSTAEDARTQLVAEGSALNWNTDESVSSSLPTPPAPTKRSRREVLSPQEDLSFSEFLMTADANTGEEIIMTEDVETAEEIEGYLKHKLLPHSYDPLKWWRDNSTNFPRLARLSRKYLCTPATSVPSEQLFSGAGIIYDPLRNRLKGEKAEKLLFLKYNLTAINFCY